MQKEHTRTVKNGEERYKQKVNEHFHELNMKKIWEGTEGIN